MPVALRSTIKHRSQNKITFHQIEVAIELDLEVGLAVAVGVAFDTCLVGNESV